MKTRGFSLIEVIVSIVIIAITSLSVPVIISVTSEANLRFTIQEMLLNAKTYLNTVLKSQYTCAYIRENPSSPMPRFALNEDIIEHGYIQKQDPNFSSGSYDFYKKYKLNPHERRIILPATGLPYTDLNNFDEHHDDKCPVSVASSYGIKTIWSYNGIGDVKMFPDVNNDRDFVTEASYEVEVDIEKDPFNDSRYEQKSYDKDLTHVVVDIKSDRLKDDNLGDPKIRLLAITANIGDSPIIQTREFK
ncbi:prepilin-type N-terminal cleavage/methylation domain-containing protein [Campylobacter pinnipediorum]|uniref:prepilin-type N-terminal cleavage/methylation domain-containing protein n=1 Tax=Campylobacter pinnipediorum TaxID=1965231 RepID=UPI00084CE9A1|nr:prepilin-type N-terminal cleavage/methylation domain-containing protein [Campylobacter pinnipediorum]